MRLDKHYAIILRVILGFVIASSLKILPAAFESPVTFIVSLVCFAAGFVIVRAMDCAKAKRNDTESIE